MKGKERINEARGFVNYLRKIRPKRKWPTPTEYIGGGANGKVYLTNSGKLMKIGLGSTPQEFRPLHILKNTNFVPKFNQRNWAIVPITTGRKRRYIKQAVNLFNVSKPIISKSISERLKKTRMKLKEFKNINKKVNEGYNRKNIENYVNGLKSYIRMVNSNPKKATVFLMNKINGTNVMTLHQYLSSLPHNNTSKNRLRSSILEMIKQIKLRGVSHGNLHSGNILVSKTSNGRIKLWMIDFGRSIIIPLGMTESNVFTKKKYESNYPSKGILSRINERRRVPVYNGSRANVHMANVHYGMPFTRNMENNIKAKRARMSYASK